MKMHYFYVCVDACTNECAQESGGPVLYELTQLRTLLLNVEVIHTDLAEE